MKVAGEMDMCGHPKHICQQVLYGKFRFRIRDNHYLRVHDFDHELIRLFAADKGNTYLFGRGHTAGLLPIPRHRFVPGWLLK